MRRELKAWSRGVGEREKYREKKENTEIYVKKRRK